MRNAAVARGGRGAERRRSPRIGVNGQVKLASTDVDGFLLDASDTGVRAVLWTHHVVRGSIVELVLSLRGRGYRRRARVSWARQYREGSVVGLELLPETTTADLQALPTDLPDEVTSIDAHPLLRVGDPRSRDVVMSAFVRIGNGDVS